MVLHSINECANDGIVCPVYIRSPPNHIVELLIESAKFSM